MSLRETKAFYFEHHKSYVSRVWEKRECSFYSECYTRGPVLLYSASGSENATLHINHPVTSNVLIFVFTFALKYAEVKHYSFIKFVRILNFCRIGVYAL